jgi:hypothetical protein
MNPLEILTLLQGIIQVAPELLALYQKATSGGTVTDSDVQAIFDKYAVDRSQLQIDITAGARA